MTICPHCSQEVAITMTEIAPDTYEYWCSNPNCQELLFEEEIEESEED